MSRWTLGHFGALVDITRYGVCVRARWSLILLSAPKCASVQSRKCPIEADVTALAVTCDGVGHCWRIGSVMNQRLILLDVLVWNVHHLKHGPTN